MYNQIRKQKNIILFSIIVLLSSFSCYNKEKESNKNIFIEIINQHKLNSNQKKTSIKVFFALDPECPLSKNYTKKIKHIFEKYNKEVLFACFFPGDYYSNEEVEFFMRKYNLNMKSFIDRDLKATKAFNANVVPEVFVLNQNYEIIYQGLIDNWIGKLGRTKQYINQEYLIDAIEASLKNKIPLINRTEAIGCLIEK